MATTYLKTGIFPLVQRVLSDETLNIAIGSKYVRLVLTGTVGNSVVISAGYTDATGTLQWILIDSLTITSGSIASSRFELDAPTIRVVGTGYIQIFEVK